MEQCTSTVLSCIQFDIYFVQPTLYSCDNKTLKSIIDYSIRCFDNNMMIIFSLPPPPPCS